MLSYVVSRPTLSSNVIVKKHIGKSCRFSKPSQLPRASGEKLTQVPRANGEKSSQQC